MSSEPTKPVRSVARFAYEGLERVIHEKARLGILASLATHAGALAFSELKQLCALTDGNLNRHLQVLQDAGLVEVHKQTSANRPQTICQMTALGRERFLEYIGVLEGVVQDALRASQSLASPSNSAGWSPA
ncbi:MAG: transcriptional regulator [Pirellulales bacterium]|nr:transcriptional regulator [Pirellulales bacterium]